MRLLALLHVVHVRGVAEGRAQAVAHLRETADLHQGRVGGGRRRGALNAAADTIRDHRAPGRTT